MKPDFSDFYKFVVSIGLILISLALLTPWMVLQEGFDTQISVKTLLTLTNIAKTIILKKQQMGLVLFNVVGWSSVVIFIFGLVIVIIGLFQWHNRQIILDKKQDYDVKKAELEIIPLDPSQVAQKTLEQMGVQQTYDKEKSKLSEANITLAQYLHIQRNISENIRKYIERYEYNLLDNHKIGEYTYDILLVDKSGIRGLDGIMQIRYSQRAIQPNWVKEEIGRSIVLAETYKRNKPGTTVATSLIIISPSEFLPQISVDEYKSKLEIGSLANQIDLRFISEEQFDQNEGEAYKDILNNKIIGSLEISGLESRGRKFPYKAGIAASLIILLGGLIGIYLRLIIIGLIFGIIGLLALIVLTIMIFLWKKIALLVFQDSNSGQINKYELSSCTNHARVPRSFLRSYIKDGIEDVQVRLYRVSDNIQHIQMIVKAKGKNLTFDIKPNTPILIENISVKVIVSELNSLNI